MAQTVRSCCCQFSFWASSGRLVTPMHDTQRFMRFASTEPGPCWLWTGGTINTGYGKFYLRKGHSRLAHRCSWTLHYGEIPEGLRVLHTCDVRLCVNPDHLFLGTDHDNHMDMIAKGRAACGPKNGTHTHPERRNCGRGERHHKAKLTWAIIGQIRAASNASNAELGKQFGIDASVISRIRCGLIWKDIYSPFTTTP